MSCWTVGTPAAPQPPRRAEASIWAGVAPGTTSVFSKTPASCSLE
jgi:hypothetical protein